MMRFRYFEAPEAEMLHLLPGVCRCDICGRKGRCFSLDRALSLVPPGASLGCIECLQTGRFGFFHTTEVGYLDASGLTWYGEEPKSAARVFVAGPSGDVAQVRREPISLAPEPPPAGAIEELRRTPDFPTWNEVAWPVHCSDFMVYLGTWQPKDITAAATERSQSPQALFSSMLKEDHGALWRGDTEEWGLTFHAFRCTSCFGLRGVVDLD